MTPTYCGRFAPSPTGPLHIGSLVCAIASFLQARANKGQWLLRMEDLDPPREVPGAASKILQTLDHFGLHWDGAVLCQSQGQDNYEQALSQLTKNGQIYACGCSRKVIQANSIRPGIYPGTCRELALEPSNKALRFKLANQVIEFEDVLQGHQSQNVLHEVGDFVLKRADGLYAYQLAVVVDDHLQGVTEVVRGNDLLDNTPRQIALQRCLNIKTPDYLHIPIVTNAEGEKLSKQTHADPVRDDQTVKGWTQALNFLGLKPPSFDKDQLALLIEWSINHWNPYTIPNHNRPMPGLGNSISH